MRKPGVFIAATGQNIGKTTTSLALLRRLLPKYPQLNFMKPVGQRTIEFKGEMADEDVFLMKEVFHMHQEARKMSPVTVPSGFTKDYLKGNTDNSQLKAAILEGWENLSSNGQVTVVEGTGHTGVGSVFGMNNAQVAKMLDLPVILVAQAGIGRPIDEIALNLALFEKHEVQVHGIIFNKAVPSKIEAVKEYCGIYLESKGIEMLGVVEFNQILSRPSLRCLQMDLKAMVLSGADNLDAVPTKIMTGAGALDYILDKTVKQTLVVTPASRSDVIMAAAHNYDLVRRGNSTLKQEFTGLVLTGDQDPHPDVLASAMFSNMPILKVKADVYETVEAIDRSLAKTLASDNRKLEIIDAIYEQSLDWKRIMEIIET